MPLMPAFHRRKKEAAIIGRLIAGYGELEFLLAICSGVALAARRKPNPRHTRPQHWHRYENIGIKQFFKIRGERNRIDYAKKQMHKVFFKMEMRTDYIEIMGAMGACLKIRNLFAHSHWADHSKKRGVFFIDLEAAGLAPGKLRYRFSHADAKTLAKIEDYFWYTFCCLDYLAKEFSVRADVMRGPTDRPTRLPPLESPHVLFPIRSLH
jgi:hypothetical protein